MGPATIETCARHLLPEVIIGQGQCKCDRVEALCLLLFRMAYPVRWEDVRVWFGGRSIAWLSNIFHAVLDILHEIAERVLLSLSPRLKDRVVAYAEAMKRVSTLPAWGALDGDHMDVCRPTVGQRAFYSGNGQGHTIRALGIYAPSGLCEMLFGCVPGSASDLNMFNDCDLEARLDAFHDWCESEHGLETFVIADGIFSTTSNVLTPYTKRSRNGAKVPLSVKKRVFGFFLSRGRIGAEWGNKDVLTTFASLVFMPQQQVLHTSPEKCYAVAVLLCNLIKCASRGTQQFETYFGVAPPTLEDYLDEITSRQ
jgi:nuclease HARBI1